MVDRIPGTCRAAAHAEPGVEPPCAPPPGEVDRLDALLVACDRVLRGVGEGSETDEIWQQVRKTCRMVKARLAELDTSSFG